MKKIILALVFGAVFGAGITAIAAEKHVNISDAQDLVTKALGRIDDAQKANEFDLGGHAAKAKDLINQAQGELKQAAAAATAVVRSDRHQHGVHAMKKIILAALLGAILGSSAVALAATDHPNLRAAHDLILQAIERVTDAQKDNHFDMQGHAENAKKLLHQAEGELKLAVGDANKNEKKK